MDIIIVGCGKIGQTVIESLVSEGHDVTAIDTDAEVINDLTNMYDIMGVCGNGADCATLEEAGAQNAELIIATTGSDELNMLCCFIANKMGTDHTVARIRTPEYNYHNVSFTRQHLGLSMAINPELLAAKEFFNILKLPSAAKIENFSQSRFEMVEIMIKDGNALDGVAVSDLCSKFHVKVLVCAVQRGDDAYIPDGSFVIDSGDRVGFVATRSEMQKLLKAIGMQRKQARNVMILGGSTTAVYLAKLLLDAGNDVKIIEKDEERCRTLCNQLPRAVVIKGDGTQMDLLREEGIRNMDAFVSLTGIDEENILLSYFASSQDVPTVISKVNSSELSTLSKKMGLTGVVSPRTIISDIIIGYARALENSRGSNVETLYKLMGGKAEALEFVVNGESSVTNVPLKELKTKDNVIIGGIMRGKKTIIPAGDDMIMPGDRVVVLAANHRLQDISDILM